MKRKYTRTGVVKQVFPAPDESGRFSVSILAEIVGDEGREYYIHLTDRDVARLQRVRDDAAKR